MNSFYKVIKAIMWVIVHIMFRINVKGCENIPESGPFMLCCNHTSATDILLTIALCPRMLCFMAKREIFEKSKLLSRYLYKMGAFPVNRGGSDVSAIKKALSVVRENGALAVFPEGTRHREGPPQEIKSGSGYIALRTGACVVPASIYKEGKPLPFRRVTVRFGTPILGNGELKKPSKEEIASATNKIYRSMCELWEMKF